MEQSQTCSITCQSRRRSLKTFIRANTCSSLLGWATGHCGCRSTGKWAPFRLCFNISDQDFYQCARHLPFSRAQAWGKIQDSTWYNISGSTTYCFSIRPYWAATTDPVHDTVTSGLTEGRHWKWQRQKGPGERPLPPARDFYWFPRRRCPQIVQSHPKVSLVFSPSPPCLLPAREDWLSIWVSRVDFPSTRFRRRPSYPWPRLRTAVRTKSMKFRGSLNC